MRTAVQCVQPVGTSTENGVRLKRSLRIKTFVISQRLKEIASVVHGIWGIFTDSILSVRHGYLPLQHQTPFRFLRRLSRKQEGQDAMLSTWHAGRNNRPQLSIAIVDIDFLVRSVYRPWMRSPHANRGRTLILSGARVKPQVGSTTTIVNAIKGLAQQRLGRGHSMETDYACSYGTPTTSNCSQLSPPFARPPATRYRCEHPDRKRHP